MKVMGEVKVLIKGNFFAELLIEADVGQIVIRRDHEPDVVRLPWAVSPESIQRAVDVLRDWAIAHNIQVTAETEST